MKVRIPHDRYPHRQADSSAMLRYLGVTGKLPKEALPERLVCGVRVYVTATVQKFYTNGLPAKSSTHRIFAVCNCGKHVPVGRLHQHKCPPNPKQAALDARWALHSTISINNDKVLP